MGLLIKNGTIVDAPVRADDRPTSTATGRQGASPSALNLDEAPRAKDAGDRRVGPATCCPAASTRTCTWRCRSWARCRPTTSRPAPPRRWPAAPPRSSTSSSRAAGARCSTGSPSGRRRRKNAVADYTFHMAVTGWNERTAEEMRIVVQDEGITSFKVFMAYKGAIMVDDDELYQHHAARRRGWARWSRCTPRTATRWLHLPAGAGRGRQDRPRVPPGRRARRASRARPRAAR